jgi:hypothetical protein
VPRLWRPELRGGSWGVRFSELGLDGKVGSGIIRSPGGWAIAEKDATMRGFLEESPGSAERDGR